MKRKILIIDDDYAVLEILNEWLSEDGFQVKTVPAIDDILGLIKKFNPQIILLDYLLKGVNGGDLCFKIKSSNKYRLLPVVIFSAFPESALSLERYKCDLFIQKPFDLYQLEQKINELILPRKLNYANHLT
jgi:DNA-binding response OmpR family regulator